jgi:hypothetical protein
MEKLVERLATLVEQKVSNTARPSQDGRVESRLIFNGPPLELLRPVFDRMVAGGGMALPGPDGTVARVPVLLVVTGEFRGPGNPSVGSSGECDETHLLNLRNDPSCPSFVALVPPGRHQNRSVESTTDEYGVTSSNNAGNATFAKWWNDAFIQGLLSYGLEAAGFHDRAKGEALALAEASARAFDEMSTEPGNRMPGWKLLARIFSIPVSGIATLRPAQLLSLACGVPPIDGDSVSAKAQVRVLEQVASALSDGFRQGTEQFKGNAGDASEVVALDDFLRHIQRCRVPTAFDRATQAFYLPQDSFSLEAPPEWWTVLTVPRWVELMAAEQTDNDDLSLDCTNAIFPPGKGQPAVVLAEARLAISSNTEGGAPVEVTLERSAGKARTTIEVDKTAEHVDAGIPPHKTAVRYKVEADGHEGTSIKVISLASWLPGIFITSRAVNKVSAPKAPKKGARVPYHWESELRVPGSGRYELVVLASPQVELGSEATGLRDDEVEGREAIRPLPVRHVSGREYQIEIEADGRYQVDIPFRRTDGSGKAETCRVFVVCEDTAEEGCRSEFERLLRMNRQHLEPLSNKPVVQLDLNPRCSSLQSWLLDERFAARSYRPIVIGSDFVTHWGPPDWDHSSGPILSAGKFLNDPRPHPDEFQPPQRFVDARVEIARHIRGSSDDQPGMVESTQLGKKVNSDDKFRELIEQYLDGYLDWLEADPDTACWVDTVLVAPLEQGGRTLVRVPDAILLSPLHPVRLAWHCVAQSVLHRALDDGVPCPAVSILDPDCVPDLVTLPVRSPDGIEDTNFLSVDCNSDYWSVLWNGSRLAALAEPPRAPFDGSLGITVGGVSSGFSAGQIKRALEDVSSLVAAKPVLNLLISSNGGTTDGCNEGLAEWCTATLGGDEKKDDWHQMGPRVVHVFDTREEGSRPDDAMIANLSEDTGNLVRWFEGRPAGKIPDLGVIAQLDSSEPSTTTNAGRSPVGHGAMIRHRVRRQLSGGGRAFISESRQGLPVPPGEDALADKVVRGVLMLENKGDARVGLRFAPDVHAIDDMVNVQQSDFVAVSSAAIDPACFLGQWIKGAYLWDYDLPSYSHRAGDNSGYYLLSKVKETDEETLGEVLAKLPECDRLAQKDVQRILLEVARRGIPTVRGLSGNDSGATGNLGLFLAVRLLQDEFREVQGTGSLLPVFDTQDDGFVLAAIVPADPFRGYLGDLARSLRKEFKEVTLSRPDLVVVGVRIDGARVRVKVTPVEVKCRQGSLFTPADIPGALAQASSFSKLLEVLQHRGAGSVAWRLAYQHLLVSMIGFGLRVYSQHAVAANNAGRWAECHEAIAAAILTDPDAVIVDKVGRLVIVDDSKVSDAYDHDGDGFAETIVLGVQDAGVMVSGDPTHFYGLVAAKVGRWSLVPGDDDFPGAARVPPPASGGGGMDTNDVTHGHSESRISDGVVDEGVQFPSAPAVGSASGDAPSVQRGIEVQVGETAAGFEPRPLLLNVSDTRLNNLNTGVVGDLGTGKTQFLKSLIYQITRSKEQNRGIAPRFLIFDYKRDYSSDDFVAATGARVIQPHRIPLNLFDTSTLAGSHAPWLDRFRFFADVLDKIYSGVGPVQRDRLKAAVRAAYEAAAVRNVQPTIYDIHAEYRALLGGKSDSPMAIIDDLVDMEIFVRRQEDALPFNDFFNGVVVISLDALGQDDRSKNMLVAVMLNMFYENMLRTPKRPFQGTDPQLRVVDSYLLVDEADNIMQHEFDVLRKLLQQGREFGVGIILASQYLRHFKANATDYKEPLLTWFIHKVPNVTPAELGALGFTADLAALSDRVKTLPNHHCIYKTAGVAGEPIRGMPFYEVVKKQ